jgi:hypothetical protein
LTSARAAATASDTLAGLAAISTLRRNLDQHEHDLILKARSSGATWQQIAASLGYEDRQAAQQRHRSSAAASTASRIRHGRGRDGLTCGNALKSRSNPR